MVRNCSICREPALYFVNDQPKSDFDHDLCRRCFTTALSRIRKCSICQKLLINNWTRYCSTKHRNRARKRRRKHRQEILEQAA